MTWKPVQLMPGPVAQQPRDLGQVTQHLRIFCSQFSHLQTGNRSPSHLLKIKGAGICQMPSQGWTHSRCSRNSLFLLSPLSRRLVVIHGLTLAWVLLQRLEPMGSSPRKVPRGRGGHGEGMSPKCRRAHPQLCWRCVHCARCGQFDPGVGGALCQEPRNLGTSFSSAPNELCDSPSPPEMTASGGPLGSTYEANNPPPWTTSQGQVQLTPLGEHGTAIKEPPGRMSREG